MHLRLLGGAKNEDSKEEQKIKQKRSLYCFVSIIYGSLISASLLLLLGIESYIEWSDLCLVDLKRQVSMFGCFTTTNNAIHIITGKSKDAESERNRYKER